MKQIIKENIAYLQALSLVIGLFIAYLFIGCDNDEGGGKCFSHGHAHRFGHRSAIANTVATPKAPATSYQFNIVHMTDSIKVYDGLRYVGQCKANQLWKLILKDNL